jgi:hypothetical protein
VAFGCATGLEARRFMTGVAFDDGARGQAIANEFAIFRYVMHKGSCVDLQPSVTAQGAPSVGCGCKSQGRRSFGAYRRNA